MTKTVKALKEEYPNEMCSGNIREVPVNASERIRDKLKVELKELNELKESNKMKNPLRIKGYSGR